MKNLLIFLKVITSIFLIISLFVFLNFQFDKYQLTKNIPEGIYVTKTLEANYKITITGDYGDGVFEISEFTKNKITKYGLEFLNEHRIRMADINNKTAINNNENIYKQWSAGVSNLHEECRTVKSYLPFANRDYRTMSDIGLERKRNNGFYTYGGYANGFLIHVYPTIKILTISACVQ